MPHSPDSPTTPFHRTLRAIPGAHGAPEITISLPTTATSSVFPFTDSQETLMMATTGRANTHADRKKPSLIQLVSISTTREISLYALPAVVLSVLCGFIPPWISIVLGRAFRLFSTFVGVAVSTSAPHVISAARETLLHDMLWISGTLLLTAFVTLASNVAALTVWSYFGETVSRRLRRRVYTGIVSKPLEWFDMGCDARESVGEPVRGGEAVGGLVGRFCRESDDVRIAVGQVVGQLMQFLCTCLACLVLALVISAKLTLVILAGVPLTVVLTVVTERYAAPQIIKDRDLTAAAASRIERVINAISTVKGFNAEQYEIDAFAALAQQVEHAYRKHSIIHGFRIGFTTFVALAMFVQGFWYGAYLIDQGALDAGQVSTVFWATLLAASHVQYIMPLLIQLEKGKVGMAGLLELVNAGSPSVQKRTTRPISRWSSGSSLMAFKHAGNPGRPHRKVLPIRATGELALHDVCFHYPTRPPPAAPALAHVSIYVAAKEMTFIVGKSGSGKSTVGALLMGLYTQGSGSIEMDEQSVDDIDVEWWRSQIGMVSQGAAVIFEGTLHDNVAMGIVGNRVQPKTGFATRQEVEAACKTAMLHDFIINLPQGYDTMLSGNRGTNLSGGQRQRLVLARAIVRNPPVLVLDEALSALEAVSRACLFASLKEYRKGKTTLVITHDLRPIEAGDFVYVMQDGRVAEHGFRSQLEQNSEGAFAKMLRNIPIVDMVEADRRASAWRFRASIEPEPDDSLPSTFLRPISMLRKTSAVENPWRLERSLSNGSRSSAVQMIDNTSSDSMFQTYLLASASRKSVHHLAKNSLLNLPIAGLQSRRPSSSSIITLTQSVGVATSDSGARLQTSSWEEKQSNNCSFQTKDAEGGEIQPTTFTKTLRVWWPLVPRKTRLWVGGFFCLTMGISTPLFSFFISRLLTALAPGSGVNLYGTSSLVLVIAFLDACSQSTKYILLQEVAMAWVTSMRVLALKHVVVQDRSWFDNPSNSVISVLNTIIKDAEDARNVIGFIIGQLLAILIMVSFGLIWALAVGWQLTLTGLAIAPLSITSIFYISRLVGQCERKNKNLRQLVADKLHESAANIRLIRSMSLEPVFLGRFEEALEASYRAHVRSAPLIGLPYGLASAVPCVAEACMFYVGAVLLGNLTYTFGQVMEAFSLVIFSVSFAAQLLGYVPAVSKSIQAAVDLLRLVKLTIYTRESRGMARLPVCGGDIVFENVDFAYPTRPNQPVLRELCFHIRQGECVGLVGASGSGKSTVAALLQRLYEPDNGAVRLDGLPIDQMGVHHLRDHLGIVSQHPALFDASIADNIAYGLSTVASAADTIAEAARLAHIAEWIKTLPDGYQTTLGDNASLVSGGQAQRLQIARALVRPREVLILDECTSALDTASQEAVMQTIRSVKVGRTTLVITHKVEMMRMCDRLLVLKEGRIVEVGTYGQLVSKDHSYFAQLTRPA